jgi:hypothetical protein
MSIADGPSRRGAFSCAAPQGEVSCVNALNSGPQFPAPGVPTFSFREWHKCQARREGPERCLAQSVFRSFSLAGEEALRSAPVRRFFTQGPVLPGTRALTCRAAFASRDAKGIRLASGLKPRRGRNLSAWPSPRPAKDGSGSFLPADGSFERPGPVLTRHGSGRRSRAACKHVCRHAPHGKGRVEYSPIRIIVKRLISTRHARHKPGHDDTGHA